mmetsp:Transcript_19875/g.42778  ORF Transcript_19875/g.42778 Transcript_19875/m.42778 type:complete len:430 (-) Transcript_19875:289-1578(-)
MPRMLYCATEGEHVLTCELLADGSIQQRQCLALSDQPLGSSWHCSSAGMVVKWLVAHPGGLHVYVLLSRGAEKLGRMLILSIVPSDGKLDLAGARPSSSTGGYSPCYADMLGMQWVAIAHYLSGDISIFDTADAASPRFTSMATLPGQRAWSKEQTFEAPQVGELEPLAQCVKFSPSGKWVIVADTGQACVVSFPFLKGHLGVPTCYRVDPDTARRSCAQAAFMAKLGHRPHQLTFTPDGMALVVLQETGQALTVHCFDDFSGEISEAVQIHPILPSPRRLPLPTLNDLETPNGWKPLPCILACALPFGVNAATHAAFHERSRRLLVSNRAFFGRSTLQTYTSAADRTAPTRSACLQAPHLRASQALPVGHNPRHFTLDATQRKLIVGVVGGVDVLDVADDGELTLQSSSKLGVEHRHLAIGCVTLVEL